jgi:hypothetical protein
VGAGPGFEMECQDSDNGHEGYICFTLTQLAQR